MLQALIDVVRAVQQDEYRFRFGRPADEWCGESADNDSPVHCEVREKTIPNVTELDVDTGGTGHIRVRPSRDGSTRIRARLRTHAETAEAARELAGQVQLVVGPDAVRVRGPRPVDRRGWSTDVEIEAPPRVALMLKTRIGSVEV